MIAVDAICVNLVQFLYTAPTLLCALDLFNLTMKSLGHIVYMYVCNMNQIVKQDYVCQSTKSSLRRELVYLLQH